MSVYKPCQSPAPKVELWVLFSCKAIHGQLLPIKAPQRQGLRQEKSLFLWMAQDRCGALAVSGAEPLSLPRVLPTPTCSFLVNDCASCHPSCCHQIHTSARERGAGKRREHLFLFRATWKSRTSFPINQNPPTWPHLASREAGKCMFGWATSCQV